MGTTYPNKNFISSGDILKTNYNFNKLIKLAIDILFLTRLRRLENNKILFILLNHLDQKIYLEYLNNKHLYILLLIRDTINYDRCSDNDSILCPLRGEM
jgi:hypothetical protein